MIDQHFTPEWLADVLATSLPSELRGVVVDPAAGAGSLLEGVARLGLKGLEYVAVDNDASVVRALKASRPEWTISRADTLDPRSRSAAQAWRMAKRIGVDLVVLNPPFSYRGGPATPTKYGAFLGRLSPSAQFLAVALSELNPRLGIWAILPDGVIGGEKYQEFWNEVSRTHSVEIVRELTSSSFSGVRARCSLVAIRPQLSIPTQGNRDDIPPLWKQASIGCRCVEIVRGRVQRHKVFELAARTSPYIHTTHIRENALAGKTDTAPTLLATKGPFVVIPRIGSPVGKITALGPGPWVLSDCLIAVRPIAEENICKLERSLASSVFELQQQYRGTGALYLTIDRLSQQLSEMGWHPVSTPASAEIGICRCGSRDRTDLKESLSAELSA